MKKRNLIISGLAVLTLGLGACSNQKQQSAPTKTSSSVKMEKTVQVIDQELNPIDGLEYHLNKVTTEQLVNIPSNYTKAEKALKKKSGLGNKYYRTTITYTVTNQSESPIDLEKVSLSLTTDHKKGFTAKGNVNHYVFNGITSGYQLEAGASKNGKLVILSSHKLDLSKFKLHINTSGDTDDTNVLSDSDAKEANSEASSIASSNSSSEVASESNSASIDPQLQNELIDNDRREKALYGSNQQSNAPQSQIETNSNTPSTSDSHDH